MSAGWVLYDGECPLCLGMLARYRETFEKRGFQFAPLQEVWVREKLALGSGPVPGEMKLLLPEGKVLGGPEALLHLASKISWGLPLALLGRLPGIRGLLDREYRRVAANRFGLTAACPMPGAVADETERLEAYSWRSFLFGLGLWGLLALANLSGFWSLGIIPVHFLLAPLALVPLGLGLVAKGIEGAVNPGFFRFAVWLSPYAGLLAAGSFVADPGLLAGALAGPWLLVVLLLAGTGLFRLLLGGFTRVEEIVINVGLLLLPAGAAWFLLSRLGASPMGFEEPIVLLTGVHFHYTAFLAPLVTALAARSLATSRRRSALHRVSLLGLIGGTPLLALGWTLHAPALKLAAVGILVASLLALGVLLCLAAGRARDGRAEGLLGLAGMSLIGGMLLAGLYGASEFAGASWITIPQMAASHGLLNGVGFSLCGVLGWTLEKRWKPISTSQP